MAKKTTKKSNGFIILKSGDGNGTQIVNLNKVQSMRSAIDDRTGNVVTFIYFDGPGSYAKTANTLEEIIDAIGEAGK